MDYPRSYGDAQRLWQQARFPDRGKPLSKHTRVMCHGMDFIGEDLPAFSFRLHDTDIVTWYANGLIHVNHGGWTTPTTKDYISAVIGPTYRDGTNWWELPCRIGGRMKSGWTDRLLIMGGVEHSWKTSYFYIKAANGSYIIPDGGIDLDEDKNVIDPDDYETLDSWLARETEEAREYRRMRKDEKVCDEIQRFLTSTFAASYTPFKTPLALIFPRTHEHFVPSMVMVNADHRSKLKEELLLQASLNGNRIDIVRSELFAEAVAYIKNE